MDLKLEIEALIQIKDELSKCRTELDEVSRVITDQKSALTTWKGKGKTEYIKILESLQTKSENCSTRIANSSSVLSQSLQKYVESENAIQSQNNQLSADDIF